MERYFEFMKVSFNFKLLTGHDLMMTNTLSLKIKVHLIFSFSVVLGSSNLEEEIKKEWVSDYPWKMGKSECQSD